MGLATDPVCHIELSRSANRVTARCSKRHRYWITSSVRASNFSGKTRPRALVILKLISNVDLQLSRRLHRSGGCWPHSGLS